MLLPILAFYIGHYIEMDTFLKDILDSLTSLVGLVEREKKDLCLNDARHNCSLGLHELELLIRMKVSMYAHTHAYIHTYIHSYRCVCTHA